MPDKSARRAGRGEETKTGRATQRFPRPFLPLPVTVRCAGSTIEGYAEHLTGTEVLVQALGAVPAVAGDCELTIDLALGTAHAHGGITHVDPEARTLSVVFTT